MEKEIIIRDHNDMPHWMKYLYYPMVLFTNVFINKIPSRHIRKWWYQILGVKIGGGVHTCSDESRFCFLMD